MEISYKNLFPKIIIKKQQRKLNCILTERYITDKAQQVERRLQQ